MDLLASARRHFHDAAWMLPEGDAFAAQARRRETALDKQVPTLKIYAADLPPGATVRLNGSEVSSSTFGVDEPMDAGSYTLTVTMPGHADWSRKFEITDSERASITAKVGPQTELLPPAVPMIDTDPLALPPLPPDIAPVAKIDPAASSAPAPKSNADPSKKGPSTGVFVLGSLGVSFTTIVVAMEVAGVGKKGNGDKHGSDSQAATSATGAKSSKDDVGPGPSLALGLLAGSAMFGSAIVAITSTMKTKKHRTTFSASVSSQGGMIGVTGTF